MAKKTVIAAEIKMDSQGAATTVGELKKEIEGIGPSLHKVTEGSIAQLKLLKKELKQTAAGSEDFKKLYNQIDDLEDKIKGSKKASADWIDTLESAGGPVGMLGGALNKAKVATSSFGAALKATGIGLIVALVGGLVAAFAKNDEAMRKLQPLFDKFGRVLNGVLGAMQPLIDAIIDLATRALPYVSKAFEVAYSITSAFMTSLGSLGSAIKKFIGGDFSGAWDAAKKSVTDFGTNYEAANKRFMDGSKELTDHEKAELEKRAALKEAAHNKAVAAQAKVDADILAADKKTNDELLKEWEAYIKRRNYAAKNAVIVSRDDIAAQNKETSDLADKDKAEELAKNITWQERALSSLTTSGVAMVKLDAANADAKMKISQDERDMRVNAALDIADAMMALGSIIGEQTAVGKTLGVATALINTYIGASEVIRAKSTLPEPFGTIQKVASVAGIIAIGVRTVKSITAVQVPGGRGGGGMPSMPSISSITAPLSPTASVTTLNQGQVNQMGNASVKAYVVATDINGAQERIIRLNRAARIS